MKKGRTVGNHPKIGIRPIIDARQNGVRESLEDRTMGLAHSVARLLSGTLKYSDGTPVECVVADTTIGNLQTMHFKYLLNKYTY